MAGERILLGHEIEGGVELVLRHLPRDQRAVGELVGKQGLADAADDAGLQHRADALQDGGELDAALLGDHPKWFRLKSADAVLAHRENLRVHRIIHGNG